PAPAGTGGGRAPRPPPGRRAVVEAAGGDVYGRGEAEPPQDREGEAVVVGVAVVEGDRQRAWRPGVAAADALDQLGEREHGAGALDEGHLQPQRLDRHAD